MNDPTYPHVSVQYKKSGALAGSHSESLAFTRITYDLLDSNVHNIRIIYRRQIDKINFRTDNFHFTQFESEFLDFESPSTTDWFSDPRSNSIGLLQIYIDDMLFPVLSVPLNLAKMLTFDEHTATNPITSVVDPLMAGKAYVSITATTNTINYGAFQLLAWRYNSTPMCPIQLGIRCSNSMLNLTDKGQSFLTLTVKNIGVEKIYVKFKYQTPRYNPVN